MNYKDFERIRVKQGKSQQHVAVAMGLSLTAYRNKEKGRTRFYVDEIESFADAVDLSTKEVLSCLYTN